MFQDWDFNLVTSGLSEGVFLGFKIEFRILKTFLWQLREGLGGGLGGLPRPTNLCQSRCLKSETKSLGDKWKSEGAVIFITSSVNNTLEVQAKPFLEALLRQQRELVLAEQDTVRLGSSKS